MRSCQREYQEARNVLTVSTVEPPHSGLNDNSPVTDALFIPKAINT